VDASQLVAKLLLPAAVQGLSASSITRPQKAASQRQFQVSWGRAALPDARHAKLSTDLARNQLASVTVRR